MNKEIYQIIEENKKLIYKIASFYSNYSNIDDLFQVGCIGLINAYRNYKKEFNTKFSTYAYSYILGEITAYLRSDRLVKVISENAKIYKLYEKARDYLISYNGCEPTFSEIAHFMNIDEIELYNAISNNYPIESFDKEIGEDLILQDVIGIDNREEIERDLDLKKELDKLTARERELIRYRYYNDYTQSETAELMGISQVQVSREESKILSRMKSKMAI